MRALDHYMQILCIYCIHHRKNLFRLVVTPPTPLLPLFGLEMPLTIVPPGRLDAQINHWHPVRTQHSLMGEPRIPRESQSTFLLIPILPPFHHRSRCRSRFRKEHLVQCARPRFARSSGCRRRVGSHRLSRQLPLSRFGGGGAGGAGTPRRLRCSGSGGYIGIGVFTDMRDGRSFSTIIVFFVYTSHGPFSACRHELVDVDGGWWMCKEEFGIDVVFQDVSSSSRCIRHTE